METTTQPTFQKDAKITWYRCQIDKARLNELMQCSDWQGFRQAGGHLGLWLVTGSAAYLTFRHITTANWYWSVPLLLVALFVHGTVGSFLGGTACHELSHKTPFKTKSINETFLKVFAFLAWWDHVWFRPSHIRHHQVTVHHDYDGEVVLPQTLTLKDWKFWLGLVAWNPRWTWDNIKRHYNRAMGRFDNAWYEFVMPENNAELCRQHRAWARNHLLGHLLLALVFIATGHWFLIVIVNLGTQYCGWLQFLCGTPQHYGMTPNVPDHRLSCRTYTCSWLPAFLYWNMQYHIEHHMFPAVPFYQLPQLRKAIEHDLPPAPRGLRATWKEMLAIHKITQTNPKYTFTPQLPSTTGGHADDRELEQEAALSL